jgi:hypothetical protein
MWHDAAGKSAGYRIRQSNQATAQGLEVALKIRDGELSVFGSSSTHAEGNYIAWRETLRRVTG